MTERKCFAQQLWAMYCVLSTGGEMASFARKFGWVLVVAVLLLFLFPLQWGSFTQTHGPTTAFRAANSAYAIMVAIVLGGSLAIGLITLQWFTREEACVLIPTATSSSFYLRC